MDTKVQAQIWQEIHNTWVEPELEKRRASGNLPDDFKIRECLITMPKDRAAIVAFNNEFGWRAKAKRGDGSKFTPGEAVYLHEIHEIESVYPPEVDKQRVAFIFIYWNGLSYQILCDFTPNWPDEQLTSEEKEWRLGEVIARYLQAHLTEKVILMHDAAQESLQTIGLWAAPALLPYPLALIIKQLQENNVEGGRNTLVNHCTTAFIRELVDKWWSNDAFRLRQKLIEEALQTHDLKFYHMSIHALLPQIEGVMTDWEYSLELPEGEIPWREESKTKKFKDLALGTDQTLFTYRRIVESISTFVLDGPALQTYKKWQDSLDLAFPNRNAIAHGKYVADSYTEENSIKLFLLLDTIFQIVSAREIPPVYTNNNQGTKATEVIRQEF